MKTDREESYLYDNVLTVTGKVDDIILFLNDFCIKKNENNLIFNMNAFFCAETKEDRLNLWGCYSDMMNASKPNRIYGQLSMIPDKNNKTSIRIRYNTLGRTNKIFVNRLSKIQPKLCLHLDYYCIEKDEGGYFQIENNIVEYNKVFYTKYGLYTYLLDKKILTYDEVMDATSDDVDLQIAIEDNYSDDENYNEYDDIEDENVLDLSSVFYLNNLPQPRI